MAAAQVTTSAASARTVREVEVNVPGDKSITHRALIFGALANGESRIRGALASADPASTAHVLRALGIDAPAAIPDSFTLRGRGVRGLAAPHTHLDCGNSGTTARLMMGALAGFDFDAVLCGDGSLSSRPMRRVTTPLSAMGATFTELGAKDRLPVRMRGGDLTDIDHVSLQSSAQVKSALLLAGLTGNARVTITEPRMSRDHSERMLSAMGATLYRTTDSTGAHAVRIDGAQMLAALDLHVPADFSSAAFFIACGLLAENVRVVMRNVGLNPGRTGMLHVLHRMQADIRIGNERTHADEPVGDISVAAASLRAVTITGDEVPALIDEIPVIAVLAARAAGETRITGANELRVKETDRIRALVLNLRAIGVDADELEDGLVIEGTDRPLSGTVATFGDHRIAMAFGVLGSLPGCDVRIDDPAIVNVSFPDFWQALSDVTGAPRTVR